MEERRVDLNGSFSFETLEAGIWIFDVFPGNAASRHLQDAPAQTVTVSIRAGQVTAVEFPVLLLCTIRGRVLFCPDQRTRVSVGIQQTNNPGFFSLPVDADGFFEVANVTPGVARLCVLLGDRPWNPLSGMMTGIIEVPARPQMQLDIRLACGVIEGRIVRDSDFGPVEGITVSAYKEQSPVPVPLLSTLPRDGRTGVWTIANDATTDSEGYYRIEHLLPDCYIVRACLPREISGRETDDLVNSVAAVVCVEDHDVQTKDFVLGQGAIVSILVCNGEGVGIPGAVVSVEENGEVGYATCGSGTRVVETDKEGRATISGVGSGRRRVLLDQVGESEREIQLRTREKKDLILRIEGKTRVRVRTRDRATGEGLSGKAWLRDGRGKTVCCYPHPLGIRDPEDADWLVAFVPPGTYEVRSEVKGYAEVEIAIDVGRESPEDVVLEMEAQPRVR